MRPKPSTTPTSEDMEKELIDLALQVPGKLLQIGTDKAVLTLLDSAVTELGKRLEWARRLALGPLARGGFADKSFDSSASDLLQAARRQVHTLTSTHAAVGPVFAVARARIGASRHGHLVEAYEARRHDAVLLGRDSLIKLLEAAGYAEAAADAFDFARGVSYTSPLWRGWTTAAEDLARAAHTEASAALDALLGMQDEVCLEYFAASRLAKAVQRDWWVKKAQEVPPAMYTVATFVPARVDLEKPKEMVAAALADLSHVLDLHDRAGRILASAARRLGLPRGDLWSRWSTRHGEVVTAGEEVAQSLESAAKTLYEVELAGGKPPVHLLRRAREELSRVRDDLRRFRTTATLEFFDSAWITLKSVSE